MASAAGGAAGGATGDVEGYTPGYVVPRSDCPHLPSPHPPPYPPMGSHCYSCGSMQENWVCLTCQMVQCGRYVNGHMLAHFRDTDHAIATSYSDLSMWCFKCDAYLDAQAIPELRSIFSMLHRLKFGEEPLLQHEAPSGTSPTTPLENGDMHDD